MSILLAESTIVYLADRNKHLPNWSQERLARSMFNRNEAELPRYRAIERSFAIKAKGITNAFKNGQIDKKEAMKQMRTHLQEAETHAFISGKRAQGTKALAILPAEQRMLDGRNSRNMRYYSRFLSQISEGTTIMPIDRRADMYAQSLWSIYNRGQAGVSWMNPNADARFAWVMDPAAEHCQSCLERFQLSIREKGLTWDQLIEIGFPGEQTDCGVHDRCHVQQIGKPKGPTPDDPTERLLNAIVTGDDSPIPITVAGMPPVALEPARMAQSIATAGTAPKMEAFIDQIPSMLDTLLKPRLVYPMGEDMRIYEDKYGKKIEVQRLPSGIWTILGYKKQ